MSHIMISYQWDNQEFCTEMKDHLVNLGYKVWLDVEQMHGSTLEAMANAVENSYCVIMCISQKYKDSKNCNLEAEYAHGKGKIIIPLMMEEGYKPDGWLGIILGSKLYFDTTKFEFEECMQKIVDEIEALGADKSVDDDASEEED